MSNFDYADISNIAFNIFCEAKKNDDIKKQVKRAVKSGSSKEEVKDISKDLEQTKSSTVEDEVAKIEDSDKKNQEKSKNQNNITYKATPLGYKAIDLAKAQIKDFQKLYEKGALEKYIIKDQDLINTLISLTEKSKYLLYKSDVGESARGVFEVRTSTNSKVSELEKTNKLKDLDKFKYTLDLSAPEDYKSNRQTVLYSHNKNKEPNRITFSPGKLNTYNINITNTMFGIKLNRFNNDAYFIKMLPGYDYDFLLIMKADEDVKANQGLYYSAFDFLVQNF